MEPEHSTIAGSGVQQSDELLQPTAPAISAGSDVASTDSAGDTAGATESQPSSSWPPRPAAPPPPASTTDGNGGTPAGGSTEPAPVPIMFPSGGTDGSGAAGSTPPAEGGKPFKPWSDKERDQHIGTFLNFRSMLQGKLLASVAGIKDTQLFALTEEEMETLGPYYRPWAQKFLSKIPEEAYALMTEVMIMGPKISAAIEMGRTNKANAAILQAQPGARVQQAGSALAQAAGAVAPITEPASGKRKKFTINSEGMYTVNENGSYRKQADQTEKAHLQDIANIVRDSDRAHVLKAFPGVDLSKYEEATA